MTTRSPSLAEVLRRALDARLASVRVSLPARVERFDPVKRSVDVKPLLREPVEDGEAISLPVITNVPVAYPMGGGYELTFPLAKGDPVLLVFSDRSLDRWLAKGGEVDPVDLRGHALSDAVAIPGVESFANVKPADDTNMVVGGTGRIEITPDGSVILGGGNKPVAREGDPVSLGYLMGATAAGPVAFQLLDSPPDPLPEPPPGVPGSVVLALDGKITGGAQKVKA